MTFVVHYAELGIKGNNRDFFEEKLVSNIKRQLKGLKILGVMRNTGIVRVEAGDADPVEVLKRLKMVAGAATVSSTTRLELDADLLVKEAVARFVSKTGTFRVTMRRPNKRFLMTSQELSAIVGEAILNANPNLKVDLNDPDHTCWIEVTDHGAYVSAEKVRAAGGLPLGTSGKLVSLLSGGIDSPVASWMMARRGAPLHYVHFHNFPYTDRASINIVKDLARVLNRTAIRATLSLINLTPVQEEIAAVCNPQYRVILYRRMMFRIAERIALREGAGGLVTGESLGQVASQTVENMRTIEAVTVMPVLRPLIGMDKEEIMTRARQIGTYELSILPHSDCCSLFMPPRPATKSIEAIVAEDEKRLDIEKLIARALAEEESIDIREVAW
jgi:thiamine biosynthesis protein ThiI